MTKFWDNLTEYEKEKLKRNLGFASLTLVFIFLIVGVIYLADEGEPTSCLIKSAHVSSYKAWVEHHSETELKTFIDVDGELETEFVTDYWTEETNSSANFDTTYDCFKNSKIETTVAKTPTKPKAPYSSTFDNFTLEHELHVTYVVQTQGGRVSKLEYNGFQLGTSFTDSVKVGFKNLQRNAMD